MKLLDHLFVNSPCDKGSNRHNYANTYDEFFSPLRDQPIRFLEIGVEFGHSAKVWLQYFRKAQIYGVDIKKQHDVDDPRFHFFEGDQREPEFWNRFNEKVGGGWDVVIDDGCHHSSGIMVSFNALWPKVLSGGLYVVEDLMCSYLPSCDEPGWPNQIEFLKSLVDSVNSQTKYVNTPEHRRFSAGTLAGLEIDWIRFSEELCIIKKK